MFGLGLCLLVISENVVHFSDHLIDWQARLCLLQPRIVTLITVKNGKVFRKNTS